MEDAHISFRVDGRLRVSSWDEGAVRSTGVSTADAVGRKYYSLIPRIMAGGKDAVSLAIKEGSAFSFNGYSFKLLTAQVKADIRINPHMGGDGKPGGASVEVFAYSTAREKPQEPKRPINSGKMAMIFAHSVRNPLNAIKGAVVYLRGRYSEEPAFNEFARIIEDEISKLDEFISKFLSSSASEPDLSEIDINSLLKKIEVLTSLQTNSRHIKCCYSYGPVRTVMMNYFQVEQAILNVINNAIGALDSGGEFTVKTAYEELQDKGFSVIEVADSGPGMAVKADEAAPLKRSKGRGFGLLITSEILKQHGGRMEIKGRREGGTTVKLYLPINGGRHSEEARR